MEFGLGCESVFNGVFQHPEPWRVSPAPSSPGTELSLQLELLLSTDSGGFSSLGRVGDSLCCNTSRKVQSQDQKPKVSPGSASSIPKPHGRCQHLPRLCLPAGGEARRCCPCSELGQVRLQATGCNLFPAFRSRSCIFDLRGHARISARRHRWFSLAARSANSSWNFS